MRFLQAYELLADARRQGTSFVKITDPQAEEDVLEMAKLGLVEAVLQEGSKGRFTAISRVTEAGETFLRVFAGKSFPPFAPEFSDAE